MNSSSIKRLIAGVILLLFLSACVPYHQAYYPAGGAYSRYGVSQGYNHGGHPYNNHNNYPNLDHHEGYHYRPSWNNGGYGQYPSHGYNYNHHNPSNHGGGQRHYSYGNDHHSHHGNH